MSNGRFFFEINAVSYNLHFGMKSVQIFAEKSVKETIRLNERGEEIADNIKAFAYIIYAGLCNYADIVEKQYPSFEDAYLLTEEILLLNNGLQSDIYKCWEESRPTIKMFERLGINQEEKKSPTKSKAGKK